MFYNSKKGFGCFDAFKVGGAVCMDLELRS